MMMILILNPLQLNVSHFGQKYLQNNRVDKMAGLRTNTSFIVFGNDDVVILGCDHPGNTQPSQLRVVSFVDFSFKKQ